MSFQTRVNVELPAAFPGDFASTNPRVTTIGTEGSWFAGAGGVAAASFVWVQETTRQAFNSAAGAGVAATVQPDGFIRRGGLSAITTYPQESTMQVLAGTPLTIFDNGEFWIALPVGVTAARKAAVYCDPTSGLIVASTATGAVLTGYCYAESGVPGDMVKISSWLTVAA